MLAIVTEHTVESPPSRPGAPPGAPERSPFVPDSELGKIIKLVPTEVVGLYVTAMGFAGQAGTVWFKPIAFGCGSFMSRLDGSKSDHLTSFRCGRRGGSGFGTVLSA